MTRIFRSYDKSGDGKITFEEWLAMREGEMDSARRAQEQQQFSSVDRNKDGTLSLEEVLNWKRPTRDAE
jgi:Ca2+-binding EF-hand superfamily protein